MNPTNILQIYKNERFDKLDNAVKVLIDNKYCKEFDKYYIIQVNTYTFEDSYSTDFFNLLAQKCMIEGFNYIMLLKIKD